MAARQYGHGPDQIDPFFAYKREWSKVKDEIVSKYFACYLKTIPKRGRRIVIVDGFSGPGNFGDGNDGSPLTICKAVRAAHVEVGVTCLFAEAHPVHRTVLAETLQEYAGIAEPPLPDFPTALARALRLAAMQRSFSTSIPTALKTLT